MRRFCEAKKIPYLGDVSCMLHYVNLLMNTFCDVDFLRVSRPAVSYSYYCDWMIVFYTNRNIRQDDSIDTQKEDELVHLLHKLLRLPEKPPKLWFWADMGESVSGSWYVASTFPTDVSHQTFIEYRFVSTSVTLCMHPLVVYDMEGCA